MTEHPGTTRRHDAAGAGAPLPSARGRVHDAVGIAAETCLVRPDDSARGQIIEALKRNSYEAVVIGGGIRKAATVSMCR